MDIQDERSNGAPGVVKAPCLSLVALPSMFVGRLFGAIPR
jgi:hypothetical protein